MSEVRATCGLCGKPMPPGEEMFQYHGYSGPCPTAEVAATVVDGVALIAAERKRQIEAEGWTPSHDDEWHGDDELAWAAVCYAAPDRVYRKHEEQEIEGGYGGEPSEVSTTVTFQDPWPWEEEWDKRQKHDRLRQLVIAGALIAAEIDRLKRQEAGNE
jgi:hypothetical protein